MDYLFKQSVQIVKDHIHFREEYWLLASKILQLLPANFSSMHFRRGDFQYQDQRSLKPSKVYENTIQLLQEQETLYVATDEKLDVFQKDFLPVFENRYKVHHWNMYKHLFPNIPVHKIPVIEMIVATRGRVFVGTYLSTFSGYITRLRGYQGVITSQKDHYWTYLKYPSEYKNLNQDNPRHIKSWVQEYPEVWQGLD